MISFGVVAQLLIRLEERPAEWFAVTDLAAHLGLQAWEVQMHLEHLAADAMVHVKREHREGEVSEARIAPREAASCV